MEPHVRFGLPLRPISASVLRMRLLGPNRCDDLAPAAGVPACPDTPERGPQLAGWSQPDRGDDVPMTDEDRTEKLREDVADERAPEAPEDLEPSKDDAERVKGGLTKNESVDRVAPTTGILTKK